MHAQLSCGASVHALLYTLMSTYTFPVDCYICWQFFFSNKSLGFGSLEESNIMSYDKHGAGELKKKF